MPNATSDVMAFSNDAIGFIGLGVMGYGMACNLRRKTDPSTTVVVYDVNETALTRYQDETAEYGPIEVVETAAEVFGLADTVICVLPSNEAVESVWLDANTGFLNVLQNQSSKNSKILIECGTVAQAVIDKVSKALSQFPGLTFIDAPISGGPMGSKEGNLSFMVGCTDEQFVSVKPLLALMGDKDKIFHCGDVGAGTAFKLINNYISLVSVLSVSEAYNIASRMNLKMDVLTELLGSGSAQCWVVSKNNPVPGVHPNAPASNGYQGGFRIELAHKVLDLARELAEMVGAKTVLDKAALSVFKDVMDDERYAGLDARVVYKYLQENSP